MKHNNIINTVLLLAVVLCAACTDLEVEEKDSLVTQTGAFEGVPAEATLVSAYADLRRFANQEDMYALAEVTTDELLVPTRGTDWGDNGIWRSLHQHTWDGQHQYIMNSWNYLNQHIFKVNQLIAEESEPTDAQVAEGKFLRAFNMWYVLDFFRQVPFREVNEGVDVNPRVLTVEQAIDSITQDLNEALEVLPATGPAPTGNTLRASQAAAHFMLAKLYLNKHVYLNQPNASVEDMNQVIQHVDAITGAGFALDPDYFGIFKDANNSETILWTDASFDNRIWNGLHYHQQTHDKFEDDPFPSNSGGGWNGFSTTAEFYALFEGNPESNERDQGQEIRRGYVPDTTRWYRGGIGFGFLVGQQYDSSGNPLTDRAGNPLIFTKEFADPSLTGNNERHGIRVIKYHPGTSPSHVYYILARYADAYLMKIEAILRGGTVAAESALELYNTLRTIRGASVVANVTLDDILDERGRELYIEGWRRNDQIRFGTFTQPFPYKDVTEEFRKVFPVPDIATSTNPNLVPTEGY